jgi:ABC-type Mn2+/Zn2+ transport system ATPase subunit/ABC-type Mn2+/Zn2+ transport system permease subunit
MALIKCDGISIAYEGQTVVRDLSFWIEQGDYLCIVGENGSGKSTLVKSLLGLKPPFKGQILLGDGLKQDEIGYLPQQTVVQKDFPASVYEVVLSGRLNSRGWRPFYSAADKKAARENMELLGIREMEHQCFRDLSGGQKQRVLLARALCATKKLLLLDEPVTGLDPLVTAEFYQLIEKINKEAKIAVVMVSKVRYSMQAISCICRRAPCFTELRRNIKTVQSARDFWEVREMLDTFMEMMSYPFMVRAFLVGSLVALCSALLGVSLVLKRYSMIGDGLSHVGFGALAIAAALNMAPLAVAIPVVVVAAVLLLRISGSSKIKGDAAIALISTGALAIGIMVISMTTGMNTDVYNYMFGSILAMSGEDVQFSILLSVAVLILYLFFYNKIFAITFDETFARATGVRANLYNTLIAVLTAVTIVLGMRMMGALLIIFPALTSMRVFKTFKGVILNSAILSVVCLILGVTISYVYATPAGASVVVVNMAMLAVYSVIGALKNRNNGK